MNRFLTLEYDLDEANFYVSHHSLWGNVDDTLKNEFRRWSENLVNDPEDFKGLSDKEKEDQKKIKIISTTLESINKEVAIAEFVANRQSDYLLNDCDATKLNRLTYEEVHTATKKYSSEATCRKRLQNYGLSFYWAGNYILLDSLVGQTRAFHTRLCEDERCADAIRALRALGYGKRRVSTKMVEQYLAIEKNTTWKARLLHESCKKAKEWLEIEAILASASA